MKKAFTLVLSLALVFSLVACSGNSDSLPSSATDTAPQSLVVSDNPSTSDASPSGQSDESEDIAEGEEDVSDESAAEDVEAEDSAENSALNVEPTSSTTNTNNASSGSKILVAYFGVPETDGVDAVAGASRVVVDGKVVGNTQFIAEVIQGATGGNLFEIKTVQTYPGIHDPLLDFAKKEQDQNARPELSTKIDNPGDYDVIFLGYPNWWADLPQPLYTFLEAYDFSGKTIVPFCPHGGSGFSNTISTISKLQPNATVMKEGFTVSRENVSKSSNDVIAWVQGLNITK